MRLQTLTIKFTYHNSNTKRSAGICWLAKINLLKVLQSFCIYLVAKRLWKYLNTNVKTHSIKCEFN